MKRILACLATLAVAGFGTHAAAQAKSDPIGDLVTTALTGTLPGTPEFKMRATLYHIGAVGVGALDSLGCKVVPMRTIAVDKNVIPRRTKLYIKETVGLPMPDGSRHDGYWYATDVGGAIKGNKIDLFTGMGRASMAPMRALNLATLSVTRVGKFDGCPPR